MLRIGLFSIPRSNLATNANLRLTINLYKLTNLNLKYVSTDSKPKQIQVVPELPGQPTLMTPKNLTLLEKLEPYKQLARVDKPIGTLLLLYPCIWSIGLASYSHLPPLSVPLTTLTLFSIGAFVMRGAGCTINDLWDIKFDKKVARTKLRPLASGQLTRFQAFKFLGVQLSAGLAVLTQFDLNTILLGASSLSLVVVYPFMKRITYWPQFTLGLAFNWGALLGYSAVVGYTDLLVTLPLYIAGISWTLIYDTIYAHQDKVDDIKVGVKSTALFMGSNTKKYLTGFSVTTLAMLTVSGILNGNTIIFHIINWLVGGNYLYKQIKEVDLDNTSSCWDSFKNSHRFGLIVASGIWTDTLVKYSGLLA